MQQNSLIDCHKVCVRYTQQQEKGCGVFLLNAAKKGDIIEYGLVRRIENDSLRNPFLFQWSQDGKVWALASGCATYYNTSIDPNTEFIRNFDQNSFQVIALRDIQQGEEVTFKYMDLDWNECYKPLKEHLEQERKNSIEEQRKNSIDVKI